MFCCVSAIYTNVIVYHYDARESIVDLVHSHLKYILRHFKTEWHMKEPIASHMFIKYCQV